MKRNFKHKIVIGSGVLVFCFLLNSCKKEHSNQIHEGDAVKVIFDSKINSFNTNSAIATKATTSKAVSAENRYSVNVDDKYSIECVLSETSSGLMAKAQSASTNLVAQVGRSAVEIGTLYSVTYYDKDGKYVGFNRYKVGDTTPTSGSEYKFNAGEKYTFIFQSNNTKLYTVALPPSNEDLDKAVVGRLLTQSGGQNLDQMYTRIDKVLNYGTNYIDVLFEHLFCEITVSLDSKNVGNINAIGSWNASSHYSGLSLKVSDASLTYKGEDLISQGYPINMTIDGTRQYAQSSPFLLAAPDGLGNIKISGINVGGEVKDLTIPNVPLTRGKSYKLSLTLKKNSTVINGLEWAPGNLSEINGAYSFAPNLELGTAFGWQSLKSGEAYAYNPVGDPCSKVTTNGGGWRTPSHADFQAISIGSTKSLVTENGRQGVRISNGNAVVILPKTPDLYWNGASTASSTLWNRTKAPITISNSGFYWASNSRSYYGVNHGTQWSFSETSAGFDTGFRTSPSYVRCVKGTIVVN